MVLDKSKILSAPDLKRETVPVPEWGGDVLIQELSAIDRERFYQANQLPSGETDTFNFRAKLLARMIINEDGSRALEDEEAEELGKKSFDVLKRLFDVANRLNGSDQDAVKNSEPGQTESLPSDSV